MRRMMFTGICVPSCERAMMRVTSISSKLIGLVTRKLVASREEARAQKPRRKDRPNPPTAGMSDALRPREENRMIRLIKRYESRKLYDTEESRYVSLEDIAAWVKKR